MKKKKIWEGVEGTYTQGLGIDGKHTGLGKQLEVAEKIFLKLQDDGSYDKDNKYIKTNTHMLQNINKIVTVEKNNET